MQISLRTLLAFADNIYDPKSRQQVMQHIQEHPTASTALQKIHDVVHSETLAVPGNELDPNLVAAYLDHLLSDDEVHRFETLTCQSQVYLSEVASVHHLLNVVFARPATISSAIRQRLYRIPVLKSQASSPEIRSREISQLHDNQKEGSQIRAGHPHFHARQRPHLNELLSSYQRKKQIRLWGISLFCILLFATVFYLNILMEPMPSEVTPQRSSAVPVATLAPKLSNSDYFQENRELMDSPPPTLTASIDPMYASLAAEPTPPIDDAMMSFQDQQPLLQPSYDPLVELQNPLHTDPHPEFPTAYTPASTIFQPVQPAEQQSVLSLEHHSGNDVYDSQKTTPSTAAMEVHYDSYELPHHQASLFPDVVLPNRETQYGSLMQISSVYPHPSPHLIQQSSIFLDETPSASGNKIDVKMIGNTQGIREITDSPLPPLLPNREKTKFQENSFEPDLSVHGEDENGSISPVSFQRHHFQEQESQKPDSPKEASQKRNGFFSEKMKITALGLSENNLAFVAKDENSLWERAVDARSLSGEFLLVPAPFSAAIHAGNGVKLTITGDTRLSVLTDSAGIGFEYGHIRIAVEPDAIFPVSYTIKTPKGGGTLTFFSPKTEVHLISLCPESQVYAPQLLVFPMEGDSVIWTPEKTQLQLKVDANSKLVFGATLENSVVPWGKGCIEKVVDSLSNLMSENMQKTGRQLHSRVVSGATLESVLEELLADSSEEVVVLGCRWCAELGRIDIPFTFLSMDHLSPTVHKQLNDYLSEVKLRNPEIVSKLKLAEKSVNEH